MNKKILYKLLLILALLACTLLISNTKSFAVTTPITITSADGLVLTIDDGEFLNTYKSILCIDKRRTSTDEGVDSLLFFAEYGNFSFSDNVLNTTKEFLVNCFDDAGNEVPFYKIDFSDAVDNASSLVENASLNSSIYIGYHATNLSMSVNYSTLDVYSLTADKTQGELVFQVPPQVQDQVTTLAPIVEEVEAKKTLGEIVGILPVVLIVIVGLLAMRKAIAFLMRILKQG